MWEICFVIWLIVGITSGVIKKLTGEIYPITFWFTYGTLILAILDNIFCD